jgi:ketosteroid isomerase-like protein
MLFDSFWQSDNENPRTQLRIFKDTILLLPSQGIERCVAIHSALSNEEIYAPFASYSGGDSERITACGDGTWTNLVSVRQAMLEGFMSGGPICFSCDLTKISDKTFERIKNFVSGIKADRDFWMKASVRLLADTESVTVIEYSDSKFDRVEVLFFTKETRQNRFYAYPVVDVVADYMMDGELVSGRDIAAVGVSKSLGVWTDNWHGAYTVKLIKCK